MLPLGFADPWASIPGRCGGALWLVVGLPLREALELSGTESNSPLVIAGLLSPEQWTEGHVTH